MVNVCSTKNKRKNEVITVDCYYFNLRNFLNSPFLNFPFPGGRGIKEGPLITNLQSVWNVDKLQSKIIDDDEKYEVELRKLDSFREKAIESIDQKIRAVKQAAKLELKDLLARRAVYTGSGKAGKGKGGKRAPRSAATIEKMRLAAQKRWAKAKAGGKK